MESKYHHEDVPGGVPLKMWTHGVPVEDEARRQLANAARPPVVFRHIAADALCRDYPKLEKTNHRNHLGTLGTGNHFIEVCLDEAGAVWSMLHSGSRGVGNAIGTMFIELAKQDAMRNDVHLPDRDPAREGEMGIIPGSMGARSYIVRGRGNPESFHSCSHGAGRAMSRGEAKRRFTLADHRAATEGVECRKDKDVIDEIPMAYKDIDAVMAAQEDLVEVVHTLKQVVCVKG